MKDILNAIEKLPGDARRQIYDLLKREFGADSDADQEGEDAKQAQAAKNIAIQRNSRDSRYKDSFNPVQRK